MTKLVTLHVDWCEKCIKKVMAKFAGIHEVYYWMELLIAVDLINQIFKNKALDFWIKILMVLFVYELIWQISFLVCQACHVSLYLNHILVSIPILHVHMYHLTNWAMIQQYSVVVDLLYMSFQSQGNIL